MHTFPARCSSRSAATMVPFLIRPSKRPLGLTAVPLYRVMMWPPLAEPCVASTLQQADDNGAGAACEQQWVAYQTGASSCLSVQQCMFGKGADRTAQATQQPWKTVTATRLYCTGKHCACSRTAAGPLLQTHQAFPWQVLSSFKAAQAGLKLRVTHPIAPQHVQLPTCAALKVSTLTELAQCQLCHHLMQDILVAISV